MAVEAKRGCGYRKVGNIYLCIDPEAISLPCDRLPYPLETCHCCGAGFEFSRGWRWFHPTSLFKCDHPLDPFCMECACGDLPMVCPTCFPTQIFGCTSDLPENQTRAGMLWVGKANYTPGEFTQEAIRMGISRRIHTIPRDFVVGQTWVYLAHLDAVSTYDRTEQEDATKPGLIMAYRPSRIEMIVTETQSNDGDFMEALEDRGLTPVVVPDDDPDHQKTGGSGDV